MIAVLLLVFQASTSQPGTVALPDTPQGTHIRAYIEAFNTGDVKKYLAMQEEHLHPDILAKRSAEERTKMFERMRGDFGKLEPRALLGASNEEIRMAIPNRKGELATLTFRFEPAAPFRLSGIAVEIDDGGE